MLSIDSHISFPWICLLSAFVNNYKPRKMGLRPKKSAVSWLALNIYIYMIYIYIISIYHYFKKKGNHHFTPRNWPLANPTTPGALAEAARCAWKLAQWSLAGAPPLSRGMWDKPFAKRYPFKGTVIWWSTKIFFHDFCYCTKIWFLQKVQAWWEFDGQKSKEPIVIVKFTISSGNVFIIWLLQAGVGDSQRKPIFASKKRNNTQFFYTP